MKPKVFIGSSSEGLAVAYSLQSNLEDAGEITVWTQDVFRPSEFTLESLLKGLAVADMGIFVFSPDDVVRIRGAEHASARDNVVFEFGLFVGRLGRESSIIVAPKGEGPRLPSDLIGVTVLKYDSTREDGNLDAALGPACNAIRKSLARLQPTGRAAPPDLALSFIERRDQLSATQRALLNLIEAQGRCAKRELSAAFDSLPMPELHYRLEQLRLLAFVEAKPGSESDALDVEYAVSKSYRDALIKNRRFVPPSNKAQ